MQPVDFTTLTAACAELRPDWLPARCEQVCQRDRHTLAVALRTLQQRGWLTLSWHPQAARICLGDPPPRGSDTFAFSEQLRHQLKGRALMALEAIAPWERVVDLQFAQRPGEPPARHLYLEVMGKYSNAILTDGGQRILAAARPVTPAQSSARTVQVGEPYEPPPALTGTPPSRQESQPRWRERLALVPGSLQRQLLKTYCGLSPALARSLIQVAGLDPQLSTDRLRDGDWERLFGAWQQWLQVLETGEFEPGWTADGYTVLGWGMTRPAETVQSLLNAYYGGQLARERCQQLRQQLLHQVGGLLGKLRLKAEIFQQKLQQSDSAGEYRQKADLLMAHLPELEPGMASVALGDFETGEPVAIALNPEKSGIQNAQALYRQYQKLKRARAAVEPLLAEVLSETAYLEQVEGSLRQLEGGGEGGELPALEEIREELSQQGYLGTQQQRPGTLAEESQPYRYSTPSGFEIWVGRNNRQNDRLTFRTAGEYDLWFHAQESAGSHVLLRLDPGAVPDPGDLQRAADLAAYYSRARQSEKVPIIYTEPKHVYKPKGAKPGMVVYTHERLLWGQPAQARLQAQKAGEVRERLE